MPRGPHPSRPHSPAQCERNSSDWGTSAQNHGTPPKALSPDPAPLAWQDVPIPGLHPGTERPLRSSFTHWNVLAHPGRSPGPLTLPGPQAGGRGLGARAGARADVAEHVPGSRSPRARTKSATAGPAARAPGTRHRSEAGRPACGSHLAPDNGPSPGSAPRDPRAHSPLWLTQVGFRSFIVRPPPPPPPG